jgi:hypothetical protein
VNNPRTTALTLTGALVVAFVALAACGVPDSGDFAAIPENEFPRVIRETRPPTTASTTTSTTTTTVPATTVPVVTRPGPTTTTVRRTTTSAAPTTTIPTEIVHLFYVQGSGVVAVSVEEKSPVTLNRKLLDLVERVNISQDGRRLGSAIPVDVTLVASQDRGVVTIELGSAPDLVLPEDQPLFFAQIVLTMLAPSQLGQVVFTQRGIPYPAVKGDGTVLGPGEPAAWEDYADLIVEDEPIPSTTVRSTTTSAPSS